VTLPSALPAATRRTLLLAAATTVLSGCGDQGRYRVASALLPPHQPGVTTPQPGRVLVLSYDLDPTLGTRAARSAVGRLFTQWTPAQRAPGSRCTVTFGIGAGLPGRLGIAPPAALDELPPFSTDRLLPEAGGGDVIVQICADDARACAAVGAQLDNLALGTLRPRWRQAGFLPATAPGTTPRNLFGFKDGTANPTPAESERWVWLDREHDPGGTYLVVRRIRMRTAAFAALPLPRQEQVIGRTRAEGAPLGQVHEHDSVDLYAKTPQGSYVLPADAHVRLTNPRLDGGARMLRRGYSYDNGPDDRGLLFLAYMRDPAVFVRVQQRLAARDAMNAFTEHYGSALCYILPAPRAGAPLGSTLL
jgi:deferrochelatase/peroxidase EfeB